MSMVNGTLRSAPPLLAVENENSDLVTLVVNLHFMASLGHSWTIRAGIEDDQRAFRKTEPVEVGGQLFEALVTTSAAPNKRIQSSRRAKQETREQSIRGVTPSAGLPVPAPFPGARPDPMRLADADKAAETS